MKKYNLTINDKTKVIDERAKIYFSAFVSGALVKEIAKKSGVTIDTARGVLRRLRDFFKMETIDSFRDVDYDLNEILDSEKFTEKQLKKLKDLSNEDKKDNEMEFLKEQVKHLKKLNEKYRKGNILEDRIIKLFEEATNLQRPIFNIKRKKPCIDTNEELALLVGDIHAGNNINPEEMMDLNCYNMDIMQERITKLFHKVNTITDRITGYEDNTFNIMFLGDIVSGLIKAELLQDTAVVDQVHMTGYLMIDIIEEWSKRFPKISIAGVVGNHGRFTQKPHYKKAYENFDYMFYKFIELGCRHLKNVEFNIPRSKFMIKQIFNWNFLLAHGDSKVQSYAGIPFYGIKRFDSNISQVLVSLKNTIIHYTMLGHYHTSNALDKIYGKIIMNGCVSGTDEFAFNALGAGGMPKQVLCSINKEEGLNFMHDILLDKNLPI